jgi:transcriptional regulator with XRE-family HTH domain
MDDRRVGLIVRALRRRRGWRQSDLAAATDVSQSTISAVERGHLDTLTLFRIRRILGALDARGDFEVRWRGGALDRTLDEGHARLVGAVVGLLERYGWESRVEVTYSIYGERGSIDVLGFHGPSGSLLVVEVKTALTSIEETLRRHDEKVRLASRIGRERVGWRATTTSRLLVLPETSTTRDRVLRHVRILDSVLPDENVAVRQWLAAPSGTIHGRWFFRIITPRGAKEVGVGGDRVRRPNRAPTHSPTRTSQAPEAFDRQGTASDSGRILPYQRGGR